MQDNYLLQADHARRAFLGYDLEAIARKCSLQQDGDWLIGTFFSEPFRISRTTGAIRRLHLGAWIPADSHGEVMTLLDLLCDSRETRHLSGQLQNMVSFGHQFHQSMNEDRKSPAALAFQARPEALKAACEALGGVPFSPGDVAYRIPVFEELSITLQFFLGDEEFAPRLRYLWDRNALQYLKYETMYFAVDVLLSRIFENFPQ